jgi:spore coat polysaccharide biosynthesis predicted glycosyltransferase SpsG/RimJ/RimL family protein N-acetyltransferase
VAEVLVSSGRLILRVDGGPGIGWGHMARCFALAQAWIDGGAMATVASQLVPPEWSEQFDREGIEVREPAAVNYSDADWVVLDGYHFTETDRLAVESSGTPLLVIDDEGRSPAGRGDVILDQNLDASPSPYPAGGRARRLLLGTQYALLRRDFRRERVAPRARPSGRPRLVFSPGGAPSAGTEAAFGAILRHEALAGFEIVRLGGIDGVAPMMAGASLALAASGATCWELCCLGVPAVLVAVADNQVSLARALAARGVAIDAGRVDTIEPGLVARGLADLAADPSTRQTMARRAQALVDGRGAKRVVACLRSGLLRLRRAAPDDAALLWEWANDPVVRRAAFTTAAIPWDDHVAWLARQLADPDSWIYLASSADEKPVGVVRFLRRETAAEISVSVAQNRRGEGWGPAIIDAGVRRLFEEVPAVTAVTARVKPENQASLASFGDAAFQTTGEGGDGGSRWVALARRRRDDG